MNLEKLTRQEVVALGLVLESWMQNASEFGWSEHITETLLLSRKDALHAFRGLIMREVISVESFDDEPDSRYCFVLGGPRQVIREDKDLSMEHEIAIKKKLLELKSKG